MRYVRPFKMSKFDSVNSDPLGWNLGLKVKSGSRGSNFLAARNLPNPRSRSFQGAGKLYRRRFIGVIEEEYQPALRGIHLAKFQPLRGSQIWLGNARPPSQ